MNGMQFRGTEWHPERLGVGEVAGKGQRAPVPTLPQTFSVTWASVSLSVKRACHYSPHGAGWYGVWRQKRGKLNVNEGSQLDLG